MYSIYVRGNLLSKWGIVMLHEEGRGFQNGLKENPETQRVPSTSLGSTLIEEKDL